MVYRAWSPRRDRIAIGSSIAFHCCVFGVLAFAPRPAFAPDVADERVLLTSIIRIEHRTPPKPAHRRSTAPAVLAARPAEVPTIHVARSDAHAARSMIVASERRFEQHALSTKPSRVLTAPAVVSAPRVPTVAVTAVPTPTPTPTPAAAPVLVAQEAGIGNFGEDYPAKVDPQMRGALFAGITDAVQLKVSVDEAGHAVAVEFVRGPADPALAQELRARLMSARFIPAVCNGLRCAGTVPLHN